MGIKHSVDETFFDSWNKRMAYTLGYIYADGNIQDSPYMRGKYVQIVSVDKDSIDRFKSWLSSAHTITRRKSSWKNGKDTYKLKIGSHKLYDSLFSYGLYPSKSLTITLPSIPDEYVKDFVRGYFDGDGCVNLYGKKDLTGAFRPKKLSVIFTSGSWEFLRQLADLLNRRFGTKLQNVIRAWTAFQIRYSTKDALILFRELYKSSEKGEYLERKHKIFLEWLDLRKRPCGEDS